MPLYNPAGGGSVPSGNAVVKGPYTVNWNDANVLTTGVTLWTPAIGDIVYDIWWEVTTSFTGSGGWSQSGVTLKSGAQTFASNVGPVATAAAGATFRAPADSLIFEAAAARVRFVASTAVVGILVPDAGAMTAGVVKFYALVGVA